jgi:hypothetical protein
VSDVLRWTIFILFGPVAGLSGAVLFVWASYWTVRYWIEDRRKGKDHE